MGEQQQKKKDWGEVKRLSIDEVSKRKGAKEFVTVVSDVERACLLEVIDSHSSARYYRMPQRATD